MTWTQIYDAVCLRIWGMQEPPEGAVDILQGAEGIIGNIHRNIQRKKDYWFMEIASTIDVLEGVSEYDLPDGFKKLDRDGLRFLQEAGYGPPLKLLMPGDYRYFDDPDATEDYPQYYEIHENVLKLTATPASDQTLHIRYLGYLDRPPDAFDNTTDDLLTYGADVVVNLAAAEVLLAQESIQKAQMYEAKGLEALLILNEEDAERRLSEFTQIRYRDV